MEVMGLMLGQFLDDYTISCVDVFAMPQVFIIFKIMSKLNYNSFCKAWNWGKC